MTATMKSRVLVREEKGMGGISMKRLIFCGMGAGMVYFILRMTPAADWAVPSLFVLFIILLILSGTRYGVARWEWLWMGWRGRILLTAHQKPASTAAQLCQWLNWMPQLVLIQSADLFPQAQTHSHIAGIQILTHDSGAGYEILSADDVEVAHGHGA